MKDESGVLDEFEGRGLVVQTTGRPELDAHLGEAARTVYCGFDPTADSLHIGSLVPLLALRRFQLAGHRPIALVGGATGLVGDPSFKAAERSLNAADTVAAWASSMTRQVARFLDTSGSNGALVVSNLDWFRDFRLLDFLRDVGKHFSINAMVQKDSVRQRIEREGEGISFAEFTYMILQAYDFAELNRRYGCTLQIGGSDQWGNITGGIDLCRRQNQVRVHALTFPLVTKADGTKFGKTESGAVWLDPRRTSVYRFYQFWINADDRDVIRYLKFFTFLGREEIEALEQQHQANPGARPAHRALAKAVTDLIHGDSATLEAMRASEILFGGGLDGVSETTFNEIVGEVPTKPLERVRLEGTHGDGHLPGMPLPELLVHAGLSPSKGQARKDVEGGGIYVNNIREASPQRAVTAADLLFGKHVLLRKGKRNYTVVTIA